MPTKLCNLNGGIVSQSHSGSVMVSDKGYIDDLSKLLKACNTEKSLTDCEWNSINIYQEAFEQGQVPLMFELVLLAFNS